MQTSVAGCARPSAGYALPYGHAYRRGGYRLTPADGRGYGHLRTVNRLAKPGALSGRRARLARAVLRPIGTFSREGRGQGQGGGRSPVGEAVGDRAST